MEIASEFEQDGISDNYQWSKIRDIYETVILQVEEER